MFLSRVSRLIRPRVGRWGERVAARHLRRKGLRIVARNFQTRAGEIDIIAFDGETLVFVEVKTSLSSYETSGVERIDGRKRSRITRAATAYVKLVRPDVEICRVDAVAVRYSRSRLGLRRVESVRWYPSYCELRW